MKLLTSLQALAHFVRNGLVVEFVPANPEEGSARIIVQPDGDVLCIATNSYYERVADQRRHLGDVQARLADLAGHVQTVFRRLDQLIVARRVLGAWGVVYPLTMSLGRAMSPENTAGFAAVVGRELLRHAPWFALPVLSWAAGKLVPYVLQRYVLSR